MYFSFRHKWKTNKETAKELMSTYPEHIVGMVLYEILKHHFEKNIHYELSSEAEDLFEEIMDNYNAQFNPKVFDIWIPNVQFTTRTGNV